MAGLEPAEWQSQSLLPYLLATSQYNQMVEGGRFELPNPKELIYSQPRLATSLPLHGISRRSVIDGGCYRARTCDLRRVKAMLSQLS